MTSVSESALTFLYAEIVRNALQQFYVPKSKLNSLNEYLTPIVKYSNKDDTDLMANAVVYLEALGYDVGFRYMETCMRDHARLVKNLDVVKYICKDFWAKLYGKQIDKLQTDNQGTFVLQDFNFKWLQAFSSYCEQDTNDKGYPLLVFPCGVIRGALFNLGIKAQITADIGAKTHKNAPACSFSITFAQT